MRQSPHNPNCACPPPSTPCSRRRYADEKKECYATAVELAYALTAVVLEAVRTSTMSCGSNTDHVSPLKGDAAAASLLAFSPIGAQQIRPYRPALDVLDYESTVELPDTPCFDPRDGDPSHAANHEERLARPLRSARPVRVARRGRRKKCPVLARGRRRRDRASQANSTVSSKLPWIMAGPSSTA